MVIVWILAVLGAVFLLLIFLNRAASQAPQNSITPQNNPIRQSFQDIHRNKRMSILNMLLDVAKSDLPYGDFDKELQYLNSIVNALDVRAEECTRYLKSFGVERLIADLNSLSPSQKELLAVMTWDLIKCDAKPSKEEILAAAEAFESIGITGKEFADIIKKTGALMQYFGL